MVDLRSGAVEMTIVAHKNAAASCVAVSGGTRGPAGACHILSGSHDGALRAWTVGSSQKQAVLVQDVPDAHLKHYDESVHSVAFVPELDMIVSAGADAIVHMFAQVNEVR